MQPKLSISKSDPLGKGRHHRRRIPHAEQSLVIVAKG